MSSASEFFLIRWIRGFFVMLDEMMEGPRQAIDNMSPLTSLSIRVTVYIIAAIFGLLCFVGFVTEMNFQHPEWGGTFQSTTLAGAAGMFLIGTSVFYGIWQSLVAEFQDDWFIIMFGVPAGHFLVVFVLFIAASLTRSNDTLNLLTLAIIGYLSVMTLFLTVRNVLRLLDFLMVKGKLTFPHIVVVNGDEYSKLQQLRSEEKE